MDALMPDTVDELRLEAAKAARRLNEAARVHDDVRMALTQFRVRYGNRTIFDIAEAEPAALIEMAEGVDALIDATSGDEIPRWMR
jgi:hypothetical protein